MLILLTPSKTMDFSFTVPCDVQPTTPEFLTQSRTIRQVISSLPQAEIARIMSVSDALAQSVADMYHTGIPPKPALWAYRGDVYRGVQAHTMSCADAKWAQRHVLIPSALYGVLRPFDEIQPYRLEMKAKLPVDRAATIYEFWGDSLAKYVADRMQSPIIVLSSDEYARAITKYLPKNLLVITPRFFDTKPDGQVKQVPIYSKTMRGVMARWMIDERVETVDMLQKFSAHGYEYDAKRSTNQSPAYTRKTMRPLDLPGKNSLQNNF